MKKYSDEFIASVAGKQDHTRNLECKFIGRVLESEFPALISEDDLIVELRSVDRDVVAMIWSLIRKKYGNLIKDVKNIE